MFRFLNKVIHNNSLKKALGSTGGQAAIVLILAIAMVLIFYAVSLNFGHFSQVKGLVTVASNTSAGMLASYMASYAQSLSETQLGGDFKVCALTGILAALVTLIIVIIVAYLTWVTGPGATVAAVQALAVVGVALSAVSLVLQITVIQPGISEMWGNIIRETLSMSNQFTENSIQSALSKTVTDNVNVPDMVDLDGDGIWVGDSLGSTDEISRYSAYYTHRLKDVGSGPDLSIFMAGLEDFLHAGSDGWGIHDHMPPESCMGTSECHPCCLPGSETFDGADFDLRPADCDVTVDWRTVCGLASPYGPNYPWVYDATYENPNNTFFSFREFIGKDDEHRLFHKDFASVPWDPNVTPQIKHEDDLPPSDAGFYLEDATNYYVLPYFTPAVAERHKGIYPFFHKMNDWGVELMTPTTVPFDFGSRPRECHWCDETGPGCTLCDTILDGPHAFPPQILPQLTLPLDPATLVYNSTYYVDGENLIAGNPPLWVDKVDLPRDIIATPDTCAEDFLGASPVIGFWKPGEDLYCSPNWPYTVECSKNTGTCDGEPDNCECADRPGSEDEFPDDAIDGLYIGLGDFITWAEGLLGQYNTSSTFISNNISLWYSDAAYWIDPASSTGYLYEYLNQITEMRARLQGWIDNRNPVSPFDNEGYVGDGSSGVDPCLEVWCIPPDACPLVLPDESATFDNNGNGIIGDVEDIIACLNYNGNNAPRFQTCFDSCSACALDVNNCPASINDDCGCSSVIGGVCDAVSATYLPRSLIPGWDPNADFVPVDTGSIAAAQACTTGECATCFGVCTDDETTEQGVCDTANTTCQLGCGVARTACDVGCGAPLDPGYAACISGCAATEATCIGVPITCAQAWDSCDLACPPAPVFPLPDLCRDACDATLAGCTDGCLAAQTICYDAAAVTKTACDGACTCTLPTGPIGCTPADVTAAASASRGSCEVVPVPNDGSFLDHVQRSVPEAVNQAAKFQYRANFLQDRVAEVEKILPIFDDAIREFDEFLSGPAQDLINIRNNFDTSEQGLPYHAIYGWKDEDDPDGTRGKWHIVKAEARSLDHCDDACDFDQRSPDPEWPNIKTYKKSWGMKRCYELENVTGSVKFRVIRYDEERDSGMFRFPNGVPIWKFRTFHPSRPQGFAFAPGALDGACAGASIQVFDDGTPTGGIYDGAFIMDSLQPSNTDCWNMAHQFLTRGVVSETCAQYSWMDGRMNFKFVECEEF